ncbi:MAG: hypothetical protein CL691_04390 [Cellvibrionales bacterium]|nr:hypothetical protein [Cellvibrionales bacterium]|tara:strand:+ start:34415 stop:35035 length:621 start_codon:yes stop_codon:yes gene_type:complete
MSDREKKYRFDIKAMMTNCELNYLRLCQIMPSLNFKRSDGALADQHLESCPAEDQKRCHIDLGADRLAHLQLIITERCRFTTMANLHLNIESMSQVCQAACVNLSIRLYHDVNMAEVVACNQQPSRLASYQYPNELMFQPDEKEQQNRFLAEWLSLTLKQGLSETVFLEAQSDFAWLTSIEASSAQLTPAKVSSEAVLLAQNIQRS